ncbi:MAG: phage portal protein, partial [Candidatus Scalindua sp.]|nr:phage portal protein [Candidatus Scalindua sp.]
MSDNTIQKINDYDLGEIKKLFDQIRKDTQFSTRQNQQLYVNNRIKLIPSNSHKPFGRSSTGVPVYTRADSKGLTSENEINMKSHKDYVSIIMTNKSGYLSGIEVVSENQTALDKVNEFMKANTFDATHVDLVGSACAYATKALRLYTDKLTNIVTFSEYEPWTYAPFYDKTGRLVGVMQWENVSKYIQDNYQVGEYKVTYLNENEDMYFFTSQENAVLLPNTQDYPSMVVSNIEIGSGRRPHTFNGVPVVEFWNNSDKIG